MWLVKCATSLFNSFCSNVARQVAGFCLLPVLSLLIKSRLFRSDVNLDDMFDQTVAYAATTGGGGGGGGLRWGGGLD